MTSNAYGNERINKRKIFDFTYNQGYFTRVNTCRYALIHPKRDKGDSIFDLTLIDFSKTRGLIVAKKKSEGGAELVLLAIGIIFLPFVLTFGLIHYMRLKGRYLKSRGVRRVVDVWNLGAPFYSFVALILGTYMVVVMTFDNYQPLSYAALVLAFYIGAKLAQRSASCYFGAAILPETGTVVFPEDMAGYGIGDYLRLKFITNLSRMDEVELNDIEKISRQSGKRLYIHGPFGSRGISFTNKQKRDECLSAIQAVAKRRPALINEFEDYD